MKFKIDENLPAAVAELLNTSGHDAATVFEEGLSGESDSGILAVCIHERRVLVTLDLDFSNVRAYPPIDYHGLVVLRLQQQDKSHVISAMAQILEYFDREQIVGRLWIVEENRIRIRA